MISIWHLVWIVPLSAAMGVMLLFYLVIFDDCLYWLDDKAKHYEDYDKLEEDPIAQAERMIQRHDKK